MKITNHVKFLSYLSVIQIDEFRISLRGVVEHEFSKFPVESCGVRVALVRSFQVVIPAITRDSLNSAELGSHDDHGQGRGPSGVDVAGIWVGFLATFCQVESCSVASFFSVFVNLLV